MFGGDADVGEEGNDQPSTNGGAIDGRDDGFVAVEDVVDEGAGFFVDSQDFVVVAVGIFHHLQVAPGRKGATGAGDDGDRDGGVAVDGVPDFDEFSVEAGVGSVKDIGAVEGHPEDAVVASFKLYVLVVG